MANLKAQQRYVDGSGEQMLKLSPLNLCLDGSVATGQYSSAIKLRMQAGVKASLLNEPHSWDVTSTAALPYVVKFI